MKKPTRPGGSAKKRGLSQDFRRLERQYAEATIEERDHLLPDFIRAIDKASPGLSETADSRFLNGDYLKDMFDQCVQRALARSDLTPDRKTNAKEEAASFIMFIDEVKKWPVPKLAAHVFESSTLALFAGLRAGLSLTEIEKLEREARSRSPTSAGKARGEGMRKNAEAWKDWVTEHAPQMRSNHKTLTQEDLADKLIAKAGKDGISLPERKTVVPHLSHLEQTGKLSRRARSPG